MLQEGEEALKEEVEGEEGTIEAEGEVVLLGVDELVAFTVEHKPNMNITFNSHLTLLCVCVCVCVKVTCDVGQQDGEEHHRSKEGGDHDVQRIPAARGHLE